LSLPEFSPGWGGNIKLFKEVSGYVIIKVKIGKGFAGVSSRQGLRLQLDLKALRK